MRLDRQQGLAAAWLIAGIGLPGLLPAPAMAASIEHIQVQHDGNRYSADIVVRLAVPAATAYAIFADPANLPKIDDSVQLAVVLGRETPTRFQLLTEVRFCVAWACRKLHQVQLMEQTANGYGGEIVADVDPAASDFQSGHAEWHFTEANQGSLLEFKVEIEPKFWIPPMIGPWMIERSLREAALRSSSGIERLAQS